MPADLTSRVRAKLAEVQHRRSCRRVIGYGCNCDHAERVAYLVLRMGDELYDAGLEQVGPIHAWEAALAVPTEEGD